MNSRSPDGTRRSRVFVRPMNESSSEPPMWLAVVEEDVSDSPDASFESPSKADVLDWVVRHGYDRCLILNDERTDWEELDLK